MNGIKALTFDTGGTVLTGTPASLARSGRLGSDTVWSSTGRRSQMNIAVGPCVKVTEIRPSRTKPDRGIVVLHSETRNQRGEVVQVLTAKLVVPRKPQASASPSNPTREDVVAGTNTYESSAFSLPGDKHD